MNRPFFSFQARRAEKRLFSEKHPPPQCLLFLFFKKRNRSPFRRKEIVPFRRKGRGEASPSARRNGFGLRRGHRRLRVLCAAVDRRNVHAAAVRIEAHEVLNARLDDLLRAQIRIDALAVADIERESRSSLAPLAPVNTSS